MKKTISERIIRNEKMANVEGQFGDLLRRIPLTGDQRDDLEALFDSMQTIACDASNELGEYEEKYEDTN